MLLETFSILHSCFPKLLLANELAINLHANLALSYNSVKAILVYNGKNALLCVLGLLLASFFCSTGSSHCPKCSSDSKSAKNEICQENRLNTYASCHFRHYEHEQFRQLVSYILSTCPYSAFPDPIAVRWAACLRYWPVHPSEVLM